MQVESQEEKPDSFEILVIYNRRRLIIDYEKGTSSSDFSQLVKLLLDINQPNIKIILLDTVLNAEVTSDRFIENKRSSEVPIIESPPNPSHSSNMLIASTSSRRSAEEHQQNNAFEFEDGEISFQEFRGRQLRNSELVSKVNLWATKYKFRMRKCEGIKPTEFGWMGTLKCSEPGSFYK